MRPPRPRRPAASDGRNREEGRAAISPAAEEGAAAGPRVNRRSVLGRGGDERRDEHVTPLQGTPAGGRAPARPDATRRGPVRRLSGPIGQGDAAAVLGPASSSRAAVSIADRRRERRRARTMLRLNRVLTGAVALGVVVVAAWVAFFSPVFALSASNIEVTGVDGTSVTVDQVVSSVAPYAGVPLTRLDAGEVGAAVEALPAVKDARVERRWPTGLEIAVVQRTAVMFTTGQSGYWLVDDEGVAFEEVPETPAGLPQAVLPDDETRAGAAADALEVWAALDESVRGLVGSVEADGSTIRLLLASGAVVSWGTVEDSALKAQVLAILIDQRPASVYDVSAPTHPVTS
ncbi:FtsQ-type POTRA domain-containing protein [Actinomyces sp. B33]|uniref:cell division protein FtsQ/DivIB n=1 Tax=Actinomyces sp. B33 TaxID=2942131 RepID=UPI0023402E2C|nr:FtsQ-type POTRA domain-containing protein [Actinomyces sp. B33]MDC4233084.1 FtsQ-type POTRA domain-containing protein [Actinomyces sp. B33]